MKKRYLITSALPYINGIKHLGNMVGSMLPADVFARFLRQNGHDCVYICGTDEHGAPAEIAANISEIDINAYCDSFYNKQKDIYDRFGISFDFFGRSSGANNHAITKEIFLALRTQGLIFEESIKQYYSLDDERFLADRFIEGICPKCGYHSARGDQCDECGVLLSPEELIEPYSTISKSKNLELRSTKHLFFDLSAMQDKLSAWINSKKNWSNVVLGIANKWLKEGLRPRCITRDLKWGISIPIHDFADKVFYVWFDAPNAYISITKDLAEAIGSPLSWKEWWMNNTNKSNANHSSCDNSLNNDSINNNQDEVLYYQFMAKDNVPFHAIFWPSMILGSGLEYRTVDYIKGFNWLTFEGEKFSTSRNVGIFTDKALEMYHADYWRYYLITICPENADTDFRMNDFKFTINKDLVGVLGNFINRTQVLLEKYFSNKILQLSQEILDFDLLNLLRSKVGDLKLNMYELNFRISIGVVRTIWAIGNEYITKNQPWELIKNDTTKAHIVLTHCVYLIRLFAIVSYPFIPFFAVKIHNILNDNLNISYYKNGNNYNNLQPFDDGLNFCYFAANHEISGPVKLFEKITD